MTEEMIMFNKSDVESLEEAIKRLEFELKVTKADYEASEQENKELKKFFDSAAKKNTSLENKIKEYHEQYDELYWTTDHLVKDKTKLKQTLEEIRDIVNEPCIEDEDCETCDSNCMCKEILDKINEVL